MMDAHSYQLSKETIKVFDKFCLISSIFLKFIFVFEDMDILPRSLSSTCLCGDGPLKAAPAGFT